MSRRHVRGGTHKRSSSGLTIDELARKTGMTVRNVRAHQSRGLLPAPEVRGRTGYYGSEHVTRLELIKELQADGFNLEGIRRLLERAGGSTGEVLRFTRTVRSSFEDEEPELLDLEALAERFGSADPAVLTRALELGLLRDIGDGRLEAPSPRLVAAGQELRRQGIPIEKSLDLLGVLREHAEGVARAYVNLFLAEVWQPFEQAGQPAERWPEVEEALERLRPLAAESLLALFGLVMSERVEEAVGEQIARIATDPQ
jgi:DNA-binding transcriptional MerR regulator